MIFEIEYFHLSILKNWDNAAAGSDKIKSKFPLSQIKSFSSLTQLRKAKQFKVKLNN